PLPVQFPPITLEVPDALDRDDYILTSINEVGCGWCDGPYWSVILDRRGRVVWGTRTGFGEWTLFTRLAVDGDHVLYDVGYQERTPTATVVRTYLDREIETIETPGMHHGFVELPDHTIAWGHRETEEEAFESILERAPGSDSIREVWNCESWFVSRCHSNALEYDPVRDVYWFSLYSSSSLVEVDRTTGELLGYSELTGPRPDLGIEYRFDPPEAIFSWQHGPKVLDDGNLLISTDDADRRSTRVAEYTIDRERNVLTEVWSYDSGVKVWNKGDVLRTPEGTTMHALGTSSAIYEVSPEGEVLWRITVKSRHQVGRLERIDDLYALIAPAP
ncbi:MAG: hypothetical protein AAF602_15290, partial [Myxococcota bacterium]